MISQITESFERITEKHCAQVDLCEENAYHIYNQSEENEKKLQE